MPKREVMKSEDNFEYNRLLQSVGETLEKGRRTATVAINFAMVKTYWEIGRQIVEFEQQGNQGLNMD